MGFIAGGVGLIYVSPEIAHPAIKYSLGIFMVLLGSAVAVTGGLRWRKTTQSLAGDGPMPAPAAVLLLIGAIVVLACALLVTLAIGGV